MIVIFYRDDWEIDCFVVVEKNEGEIKQLFEDEVQENEVGFKKEEDLID